MRKLIVAATTALALTFAFSTAFACGEEGKPAAAKKGKKGKKGDKGGDEGESKPETKERS
ncbi:MAG: hypothetical protein IT371_10825 [Deltaproteobacteria bacterium]|nr:hypothetical protein [Deltaproteobacteria bacterium]